MLCTSIKTSNLDNRMFYQCPECLAELIYFKMCPTLCYKCGYKFPDIEKMETEQKARYDYYISSEH